MDRAGKCLQNWIGPVNCSLREARYIPPNVEHMKEAMSDLAASDSLETISQLSELHDKNIARLPKSNRSK